MTALAVAQILALAIVAGVAPFVTRGDMVCAWNALVRRAWYACGCPARFPLRRIR